MSSWVEVEQLFMFVIYMFGIFEEDTTTKLHYMFNIYTGEDPNWN